ncbi:MAG: HEPN domain-containing protein [Gemmatimonadaceae bacterium]
MPKDAFCTNVPPDRIRRAAVTAWIAKAEEDFLAADNNVRAEQVPWAIVCFHAQQAAEKYLKAALIAHEVRAPYTHDLTELLTRLADRDATLSSLADDANLLSVYAVDVRYPDFLGVVTRDDGIAALAAGRRVKSVILQLLDQSH